MSNGVGTRPVQGIPAHGVLYTSITEPKAVGQLMRAIDGYQGTFITKCALRLSPLVFLRPGELREGEWCEVNSDEGERRIPAARMKMKMMHIVPLSIQAVAVLRERQVCGQGI